MFKVFSVLAALVALAPAAQAATLSFFATINAFPVVSWDQSSTPVPLSYQTGSYTEVPVTDYINGPPGTGGGNADVIFYAAPDGMFNFPGMMVGGPQVYFGSEAHPVFIPGEYDGTDFLGDDIMLNVSTVSQGVPEAGTWILMIIGFGGVAFRASRRALARGAGCGTGAVASTRFV